MKLSELVKTEEYKVPGTDIVIVLKDSISWFDQLKLNCEIDNDLDKGKFIMTRMIERWNIKDDHDGIAPITEQVIGSLPSKIMVPLFDHVQLMIAAAKEKKNL